MDNEELTRAVLGGVRIGTVMDVDAIKKRARVKFQAEGVISDWLYVPQRSGTALTITPDGEHTHTISDTYSGGGSASTAQNHAHENSTTATWMPTVNETVLCVFLATESGVGDGFIIGTIGGAT